jgi:hypothetical protein
MNIMQNSYASDEDVALLAPSDVGPLFPEDQVLAQGVDGRFEPSDRWTLHSDSVDFAGSGLQSGHVVRLTGPVEHFRHPGVLVGIVEVGEHSVSLRRLGMAPGLGSPISPPEGLSGVSFSATTLGPQLEQASREIDSLLGLKALPRSPLAELASAGTNLRDAVVRLILARRYATIARDGDGAFASRARLFEASFERLITRLIVGDGGPRFGTRLVR